MSEANFGSLTNSAINKEAYVKVELFVRELKWEALPASTRDMVKRCVMDTLGCALAGAQAQEVASLQRNLIASVPNEGAPIWGTDLTTGLDWAIYLNACSASYFDLDDGHRRAQGHPGSAIVPAALTMAFHLNCSGKTFLEAVVCGYEIAVRSAMTMRASGGPRKGSGAWVTPGVATAIAKLMNLPSGQIRNAIALAEFFAPQAPQDHSTSQPSFIKEAIPWGAYTGHMAAFLSAHGMSAMPPLLSEAASNGLGEIFEIESVYFKRYAACRFIHPVLDGLQKMMEETKAAWTDIDRIHIQTFEKGLLLSTLDPLNPVAAVYSFPFAVASYIYHGRLGAEEISGNALLNDQVRSLSRRIEMIEDKELTSQFPDRCQAHIEVNFKNGERYERRFLKAKGDPDDPFTDEELLSKLKQLTEPICGQKWKSLISLIERLDKDDIVIKDLMTILIRPRF
jgi:2-methylcitrate dehydratase PrpD